ncbi:dihydrodipicolinate reductase [Mycobacterium sp. ACS4331]|uniref:NAD(P)H-dependent amine dehydrogenase family protein n=1 Tax=Mycobacterium sp. ACS4331 TaxID=1834121 RepID=UPI0007FC005B|nr:dihydrodipicolinate reductase [Mycobacterium sp. ACS4331]OBF19418.1 dihydrodipicolinate reductase [Mycobacterium sp. ACS4331]
MTYRVLQWGTGAVGREALRGILDHPDLTLAAVKVYTDAKVGLDAGELIGRPDVGVRTALSVEDCLAQVDCVLYTPRTPSVDDVCRLLSSGVNVVTTSFAFHPARMDTVDRDRLLTACHAGGASLHGTGLNPGNVGVVVPLALSGMCREIERVTVQERADWSMYDSVDITFDQMCFGQPPDRVSEQVESLRFTSELFRQQVWLLGDTLGADLDEVITDLEVIPASEDRHVFGRTLRAGTVAGQRWRWSGRSGGATRVEVETLWTVGKRQPAHWPTPQHGWTITIEGTPSVQTHVMTLASFVRDVPLAEHVQSASVATAMQAVNAVPGVCDAAAGFTTMADIPFVWHRR